MGLITMKKTYISPELLAVELRTTHMMAQSLSINTTGDVITDSNEILVKGSNITDINLWDDEW